MNEKTRNLIAGGLFAAAAAVVGGGAGWLAREAFPRAPECALTPSQATARTPFSERLTGGGDTGVVKACIAAKGLIVEIHADGQNPDARAQAKKMVDSVEQIVQAPLTAEATPAPHTQ